MFALMFAIGFIAYNVVFFMIGGFEDHSAVFWVSWTFMLVAFVSIAATGLLLGQKGMLLRDWLFGYPIVKHCTIYVIVELVLSTLFAILDDIVSWQLAFILQFVVFCVFMIFAISCFLAKNTIEGIKANVGDKTRFIKLLRVDAEMLCEKCTDIEVKKHLQKLAEDIRFSDPMSNDALFELEKEISLAVSECDKAVVAKDYETTLILCNKASSLLAERNKKCIALK